MRGRRRVEDFRAPNDGRVGGWSRCGEGEMGRGTRRRTAPHLYTDDILLLLLYYLILIRSPQHDDDGCVWEVGGGGVKNKSTYTPFAGRAGDRSRVVITSFRRRRV